MKGKRVLKKQRSQSNSSLLGTYFISLFSVLLCFVMLLGTTFAWFYTDNTSLGNEIHSGILRVDMIHVTGGDKISLTEHPAHSVFSNDLWTPYRNTQAETVKIVNMGNVTLDYKLDFVPPEEGDFDPETAELFNVHVNGNETPVGSLNDFLSDADDKTDDFYLAASWLGQEEGLDPDPDKFDSIQIELRMKPGAAYGAMGRSVPVYLKLDAYQHLAGPSE